MVARAIVPPKRRVAGTLIGADQLHRDPKIASVGWRTHVRGIVACTLAWFKSSISTQPAAAQAATVLSEEGETSGLRGGIDSEIHNGLQAAPTAGQRGETRSTSRAAMGPSGARVNVR